jgi:hypothetical protein
MAMILAACGQNGADGKDGKAYAIIDGWTADITAISLIGVGATVSPDGYWHTGVPYLLRPGPGIVVWVSNGTNYGLNVTVTVNPGETGTKADGIGPLTYADGKDGSDGADKTNHLFFSGNVMSYSSAKSPTMQAANPASAAARLNSADDVMGVLEPGVLKQDE